MPIDDGFAFENNINNIANSEEHAEGTQKNAIGHHNRQPLLRFLRLRPSKRPSSPAAADPRLVN